jgi:hypothetical protein
MPPLRCILAEWQLVRTRLVRSRLGLWLLLLGTGAVVEGALAESSDVVAVALRVGMLGAVLGIAFGAGSDADRAALALTLTHPTTPLAIALGRCFAAVTAAGIAMLIALAAAAGLGGESGIELIHLGLAGAVAAAATAAATLFGVWLGGNAVAGVLFLYIATASGISPAAMESRLPPGGVRDLGIALVEALPGVWRYRGLATGSGMAWIHATVWIVGGVLLGTVALTRRRR